MKIIVVEDQSLLAMLLEDMLDAMGHEVAGVAETVKEALSLIEQPFDLACLDYNLEYENVEPVAERLAEKGIPFIFMSGAPVTNPRWTDIPMVNKPYTMAEVERAIEAFVK